LADAEGHRLGRPHHDGPGPDGYDQLDHLRDLMTSRRLQREDGYVLVIALILMLIMLGIGLAAFNFVGTEQRASTMERQRESELNLSEGVLAAEAYLLGKNWPDTAAKSFPATCSPTSSDSRCPTTAHLAANFKAVDFVNGMSWNVQIRDYGDVSSPNYSTHTITSYHSDWSEFCDAVSNPDVKPTN